MAFGRWLKSKTSDEKRGNPKMQGAEIKDLQWKRGNPKIQGVQIKNLRWKKRQPQNVRGSNQRPPMKKEVTPKHKGLKSKYSDEKRGNPKCKGLKSKTSDEKRSNPKTQVAQIKDLHWKKRQSQNPRGSNKRRPMKNESTPKCMGLKSKTFDEKRSNLNTQGAKKQRWFHKPKIKNR
jgi:hypothetical protein